MSDCTVKMSLDMAQALNDLLLGLNPKGRVEMREHKHLSAAIREGCFYEYKYENQQTKKQDIQHIFNSDGGTLKITRDSAIEYIHPLLVTKIEGGVQGKLSIGYNDLLDAFDSLKEGLKTC